VHEAGSTSKSIYAVCEDDGVTDGEKKSAWQDNDGLPLRGQTRISRGTHIQQEVLCTTITTDDEPINVYATPIAGNRSDIIYDNPPDVPHRVYLDVVPIAGNGPADVLYDNLTASHDTKQPSALIAQTSFQTTTPGLVSCPSPRMHSDEERRSTAFEQSEFQIDASTDRLRATSVKRQNPLRQVTPADATPRLDSDVGLTETSLPGMAGQPVEPNSAHAADPNGGYIDTVPGPSAYDYTGLMTGLRQHSDL